MRAILMIDCPHSDVFCFLHKKLNPLHLYCWVSVCCIDETIVAGISITKHFLFDQLAKLIIDQYIRN